MSDETESTEKISVIERLSQEKEKYNERYKTDGCKQGKKDAQKMCYEDLVEVATSNEDVYKMTAYETWLEDSIKDLRADDSIFDEDSYLDGWVEGVCDFWNEVEDNLS